MICRYPGSSWSGMLMQRASGQYGLARLAGAATGLLLLAAGPSAADSNPFSTLDGSWSGNGQMRLDGGTTERLKCTAYYRMKDGGSGLGIAIRCSSQNNKIELRADLKNQGGKLSGSWEERTFNATGDVTGKASDSRIALSIVGGGLTGTMVMTYTTSSQRVSITTQGTGLKGVTISLKR
jgi:hypothetical protein